MTTGPLTYVWIGVVGLFGVGLYGLLTVRNLIKVVVALQILAKSALLALVAAGYAGGVVQIGQSVAVTLIVADTIVAVVGLALAMQIRRRMGTLDVSELSSLRG
jgi:NADH:ubiquinone oxidoreductase subunit K